MIFLKIYIKYKICRGNQITSNIRSDLSGRRLHFRGIIVLHFWAGPQLIIINYKAREIFFIHP